MAKYIIREKKDNKVYVFVPDESIVDLELADFAKEKVSIVKCSLLCSTEDIKWQQESDKMLVTLPTYLPSLHNNVLELELSAQ